MHKSVELWVDIAIVIILFATPLILRVPITAERKIMPAGDVFNFQHITNHVLRGSYPAQEKRLPGYPLLIAVTRPFPVDPIVAAVGISLIASSAMLVCLYFIGLTLHIHRIPLLGLLSLSMFDPLLTIGAVRPLSDATFLFFMMLLTLLVVRHLASAQPPTNRSLIVVSLAATAMMFTRFEGIVIAAFMLPLLWLKLSWKKVAMVIAIPFVAGLLWIPVHLSIHGSLFGGYVAVLSEPGSEPKSLATAASKLVILLKSAGWGGAWSVPNYELTQDPKADAVTRVLSQGSWWVSVLAILGLPWLVVREKKAALPLIAAVVAYVSVLVWWFLYSRFVIPLVPIYYLTAAAGASFLLWVLPRRFWLGSLLLGMALIGILKTEALAMYKHGLGRAWENNQKGYALFQAMRETGRTQERAAYWTDEQINATFFLEEQGFYFNRYPEDSAEQLYQRLEEQNIRHLINTDNDPRVAAVRNLLKERGATAGTTTYRSFVWSDNTEETVSVDHLRWP